MKILFVLNAVKDEMTGAAGMLLNLGKALKEKGHEADHIFRDDIIFFKRDSPVITAIALLTFPILLCLLIFFKNLDKKYDIIDISSSDGFFYGMIRKLFKLKPHAKLIMRSHGLEHLYWESFKEESMHSEERPTLAQRLFMPLVRMREIKSSVRNCDGVICLNPNEKRHIEKILKANSGVTYIPHGVSESFFVLPEPRREGLLFIGDWNWRKGRRYLVRIFLSILEKKPDAEISILPHRNNEKDVLVSFPKNARGRIKVVRNLSLPELLKLYASSGVFLFPTIFEGFGLVILEAMAAAMPVITTDDFGWNGIITSWENGVLISKRNVEGFSAAAIKLLGDDELRERIGQKARQTARNFLWKEIAAQTISCYESTFG